MSRSTSLRGAAEQQVDGTPSIGAVTPTPAATTAARMAGLRILHVDDEPDIREVVELSLSLDPAFMVRSCDSGKDALVTVVEWPPDLILCDVMMPVMDGPATLARLRESPRTAHIPLVFMTARAQTRELEHFKSLGAVGVISKPFDPMTLAASIRDCLRAVGLSALHAGFVRRLRVDATTLRHCRADLAGHAAAAAQDRIKNFSHALAGAAGIFGFQDISRAAAELEKTAAAKPGNGAGRAEIEQALDALLLCIEGVPATETP